MEGKILSLHHTLIMRDLSNVEVARVERQLVALRPTYHITRQGEEMAAVRKKLFSPFVGRFVIDIPGPEDLSMNGSLFEHEFTVSRGDQLVATISKAWVSMTETYAVDIMPGEDDLLILASVLALDLAQDAERHTI